MSHYRKRVPLAVFAALAIKGNLVDQLSRHQPADAEKNNSG